MDISSRIYTTEQKLNHNKYLQQDIEASVLKLVDYMPVVESAHTTVREQRDHLIEELRVLVLEAVGMYDVLVYERASTPGPYELDSKSVTLSSTSTSSTDTASCSDHGELKTALDEDKIMAPVPDEQACSTTSVLSPVNVRRSSSIAERLGRVHTAASHANMRKRALSESTPSTRTAVGCVKAASTTSNSTHVGPASRSASSSRRTSKLLRRLDDASATRVQQSGGSTHTQATQAGKSARIAVKIESLGKAVKPPFYRPNGMSVY